MRKHPQGLRNRRVPAVLLGALALAVAVYAASIAAAGFGEPAHKVVIQVSSADPQVQRVALNNAANLLKAFGMDNVQVEIVAYGPGLSLLTRNSEYPERVPSMALQGIRFSACQNTMEGVERRTGHPPELLEGVQIVPSGVARIVELEEQGYAYVRP